MFLPFAALDESGAYAYQYFNIILFIIVCLGFLKMSMLFGDKLSAYLVYYCSLFCIPMWRGRARMYMTFSDKSLVASGASIS